MKRNLFVIGLVSCLMGGLLTGCDPSAEVAGAIKDKLEDAKEGGPSTETEEEGASASGEASFGSITKAQYLALLDCYLTKVGGSAQATAAIGAVKLQVNAIEDDQWASITAGPGGLSLKVHYDLALEKGCGI